MYRPLLSIAPMIVFINVNKGRDIQPLSLFHAFTNKKINIVHLDDPPRGSTE